MNPSDYSSMIQEQFTTVAIVSLIILVVSIIANWKIFTKAGEKGWKSIIPIYNSVVLFKIIGLSPWLLLIYLAAFIPVIGSIAVIVLSIVSVYYLSKSFGKGAGFTVGLIFLPQIFQLILAFLELFELIYYLHLQKLFQQLMNLNLFVHLVQKHLLSLH